NCHPTKPPPTFPCQLLFSDIFIDHHRLDQAFRDHHPSEPAASNGPLTTDNRHSQPTFPLASAPNSRNRWRNETPATLEKPRHPSPIPRSPALAQGTVDPAHHRCAVATTRARAGPADRT